MQRLWTTLLCIGLPAAGAAVFAQEGMPQEARSEAREATSEQLESLIEQLGDEDFVVRDRAYDDLLAMGAGAKARLEKATKSEDPEIRWRAGRLLRALSAGSSEGKSASNTRATSRRGPDGSRLKRWSSGSEADGEPSGEDSDAGAPDPFFRGLREWPGMDDEMRRHFQDLQRQMQDIQREMNRMMREGARKNVRGFSGSRMQMQMDRDGQRLTLRSDDNGVEATVTEMQNGEEVTETYKARDLDDFKAKFPEVASRFDLDGVRIQTLSPFGQSMLPRLPRPQVTPLVPVTPTLPADGPRLGIAAASPSPELAAYLGLGENEGLQVMEVESESLADRAGVKKNDIVLEVNGKAIGSVQDVREALKASGSSDTIQVVVLRRGEKVELSASR